MEASYNLPYETDVLSVKGIVIYDASLFCLDSFTKLNIPITNLITVALVYN